MENITLFRQIITLLDRYAFKKIVRRRDTDKHQKGFNSWSHLISMLFCHLPTANQCAIFATACARPPATSITWVVSRAPSKSMLSYQNQRRDWQLFRDYYYQSSLGQQAAFKRVKFRVKSKIFLLDSTTISLCLSLFDWAKYKTRKGAIKMHTLGTVQKTVSLWPTGFIPIFPCYMFGTAMRCFLWSDTQRKSGLPNSW